MSTSFLVVLFLLAMIGVAGGLLTRFINVVIAGLGVAGIFAIAKALRRKGVAPDDR